MRVWSEVLRNDEVRGPAAEGFERVRASIADALRRGRAAGAVPAAVDPDRGARVVMGPLHGFLLQRVAFGLTDTAGLAGRPACRAALVMGGVGPSARANSR